MTESATEFVSALTFQALSSQPVQTQLFETGQENAMGHIQLARWADLIVVAPATANMIAKLSYGLADDLVSTLCLAASCPIYLAPAMNQVMWHKTVTQQNIQRLQQQGIIIIDPEQGEQACGETGLGRMAEPETICRRLLGDKPYLLDNKNQSANSESGILAGVKVLISAGPTREPLDPVRYLTNRSSGKMGYALAEAALQAGASVTLVSGPVALVAPAAVNLISIETAAQLYNAVVSRATEHDVYIGAAAVADYAPLQVKEQKIKNHLHEITMVFEKTKDILATVATLPKRPFVVGFAAETDDLEVYAKGKLVRKKLDMIAANWVGKEEGGFDKDKNSFHVFWHGGEKILPMTDKKQLAIQLIELITARMREKKHC
jgi:phosphopantothenoylcysteine decarboxylase/phosphopantothenate--cysteine ligase